jgi:hypothetical protein
MFQASKTRLRTWLERFDDILGDPPEAAPPHPHRTPLRWERDRRAGVVPARPAHCVCPVRAGKHSSGERDLVTR